MIIAQREQLLNISYHNVISQATQIVMWHGYYLDEHTHMIYKQKLTLTSNIHTVYTYIAVQNR